MKTEDQRIEAIKFVIDPLAPFPKRWRDHHGPIRVMTEPVEGYLMARRPGAVPFVLAVTQILNAERHPTHGPFALATPPAPFNARKEDGSAKPAARRDRDER